jgi:heme ABC exporter ATP-binding subunit CcmA
MIEALHLTKSFGSTVVLDDASFTAPPGSVTALVGPNGSGKTTTLHLLAGLTEPDGGTIRICDIDVRRERRKAAERMAFLPQDVRFHGALTPRQVLRFYADLRAAETERIDEVLARIDLTHTAEQPCSTLSGGMRQRLGLGLLLLADADVLLLDEPALSLDPEWRGFLRQWLRDCTDDGTTVLMATHLLEVWKPIVSQVLTCTNGRVSAEESRQAHPVVG